MFTSKFETFLNVSIFFVKDLGKRPARFFGPYKQFLIKVIIDKMSNTANRWPKYGELLVVASYLCRSTGKRLQKVNPLINPEFAYFIKYEQNV